jgi:hypothetical protein
VSLEHFLDLLHKIRVLAQGISSLSLSSPFTGQEKGKESRQNNNYDGGPPLKLFLQGPKYLLAVTRSVGNWHSPGSCLVSPMGCAAIESAN